MSRGTTAVLGLVAVSTALMSFSLVRPSEPASAPGSWSSLAASGLERQEVSYVKARGKLYLAGGHRRHQAYNPETDRWKDVKQLPEWLDHVQAVTVRGKIYYVGGLEGWPAPHSSEVYIYDPKKNRFSEGKPMPRPRGGGGVAVHKHKIYYAGGLHDGEAVAWFDVYNTERDTWRRLPDMPRARDHFHAAVVGGKFYAIGGRDTEVNKTMTANDAYSFATRRWTSELAPLPTARGGFAAMRVRDEILIIGGEGGGRTYDQVEAYHTVDNSWRTLPPMPTARHGIQAAKLKGRIYIAAGGTVQFGGNPTDVHEVLLPPGPGNSRLAESTARAGR